MNRRVRAKNVRVGDELEWLDLKKRETVIMVVKATARRDLLYVHSKLGQVPVNAVVLLLYKRDAKRKQTYVWRTTPETLMRVRRPKP